MGSSKPNHLQTPYHTLQKTLSQAKPSQECERVSERKKDGLALKIRWTVISVLVEYVPKKWIPNHITLHSFRTGKDLLYNSIKLGHLILGFSIDQGS